MNHLMTKTYYLVRFTDPVGSIFWLYKNRSHGRYKLHWLKSEKLKEYRTFKPAHNMAHQLSRHKQLADGTIDVVQVTFRPTNPLLPDGFYEPVETAVYTVPRN